MVSKAVFKSSGSKGWYEIDLGNIGGGTNGLADADTDDYAGLGELTDDEKNYLRIVRRAKQRRRHR